MAMVTYASGEKWATALLTEMDVGKAIPFLQKLGGRTVASPRRVGKRFLVNADGGTHPWSLLRL